jgi:hypothetical protein
MFKYFNELPIASERESRPRGRPHDSSRDRWLKNTLSNIQWRCNRPDDKKFAYYGGRGIKCLLTLEDLQFLYERDRPDLMSIPSIDRRDHNGNYTRDNCRFREMAENRVDRGKNQYSCTRCGATSFPRTINGQKYCQPCAFDIRSSVFHYPKRIQLAIARAKENGLVTRSSFKGRSLIPLKTRIIINGAAVNIHNLTNSHRTSLRGGYYWHCQIVNRADFHILICGSSPRFFIIPNELITSHSIYIPTSNIIGAPRKLKWLEYEDAWHLLNPQLDREAAELAAKIDPYRMREQSGTGCS